MKKPLELYIHIPFCVKKCNYCDFPSHAPSAGEMEAYMKDLNLKIRRRVKFASAYFLTSIFIGGGTPSMLEAKYISSMLEAVRDSFEVGDNAEITIEVNPGTINREKFRAYREAGINRISIGLQSADNSELKGLGRIHTYEDFLETYDYARDTGFSNINIDLMQAIPEQTYSSYEKSLRQVIDLSPEHISAYSLIIEEGTSFYNRYEKGELKLVDEDTERAMYHNTKRILKDNGYERYEISNYAKAGYECRHNIGYWECKEYLGLGTTAASLIDGVRSAEGSTETQILSDNNKMEEFMFLGLRMIKGISKSKFKERFNRNYDDVYKSITKKLINDGLLIDNGKRIYLTERGIDISNYVMSEFLL